jgi:hypothetical protein
MKVAHRKKVAEQRGEQYDANFDPRETSRVRVKNRKREFGSSYTGGLNRNRCCLVRRDPITITSLAHLGTF